MRGDVIDILGSIGIVRSDLRSSFGSSTTEAPGVPLDLRIVLVDANAACAPLPGHAIYIWQCNRNGAYSLYSAGIRNENYLRGVQVTDSNGRTRFTTIFPACYGGRYPHIHFEVYRGLSGTTAHAQAVLTSQMAMPHDIASIVYTDSSTGYAGSAANLSEISTANDYVFGAFTPPQLVTATPSMRSDGANGYIANVVIGIDA